MRNTKGHQEVSIPADLIDSLTDKVEPTDNAVWSQTFCSGPGFNSISPDIKSFIFDTQYLLVQLHDFTVLCSTKQCILACLLFCNNLFAAHLLRFAKLVKKTVASVYVCYIP